MIVPIIFSIAFITLAILRLLNIFSQPANPDVLHTNSDFIQRILNSCSILKEVYTPPLLWGRSGHLQTFVYGKLGRFKSPFPEGKRVEMRMSDGATNTFDIFHPHCQHKNIGDFTLAVCPGIANSSESVYVRTFVKMAQDHGYRVAVLNHLGALRSVKLTAPRIFTYGSTSEFGGMMSYLRRTFPNTQLVVIGFSMGANIACKYLAEDPKGGNQERVLAAVSACQGYDAVEAFPLLMKWEQFRRGYLWSMTENMKKLLARHVDTLFTEQAQATYIERVDVDALFASTSLADVDELFTRRMAGFKTLHEFYSWASCKPILDNIKVPLLVVHSEDDPIVPAELIQTAKRIISNNDKSLLVVTKHGGHLGYYEGSLLFANTITWLDRAILQYCDAIANISATPTAAAASPPASPATAATTVIGAGGLGAAY